MQAIHTAKPPCDAGHHMGDSWEGNFKKPSTRWGEDRRGTCGGHSTIHPPTP